MTSLLLPSRLGATGAHKSTRVEPSSPGATLIGHWQLNELVGSSADDAVARDNDGVYFGVTLAEDPLIAAGGGSSARFLGNSYVAVPDVAIAGADLGYHVPSYSVVVYFQIFAGQINANAIVVHKDRQGLAGGFQIGVVNTAGTFYPQIYTKNGAGTAVWFGSSTGILTAPLAIGTAYMAVLTVGPTGTRFYLDKVQIGATGNTEGLAANDEQIGIGIYRPGISNSAGFNGWIDDVRLYSGELTQSEINALANAQDLVPEPDTPITPFPFVTIYDPAIDNTGVTTRPPWNPANPLAASVIDPTSGLTVVRLTGENNDPVYRYDSGGNQIDTGLTWGDRFGNSNSPTSLQTFNADGTLISLHESFSGNSGTVRHVIIDVTGQYSGGVPFRVIRAGSSLLDGANSTFALWDLTNPFRYLVWRDSGQVDAHYFIGTAGQSPAGPGTSEVWIANPAAYYQFIAPANGRAHDFVTTRNGRWKMCGCRRVSDNLWGGIRADLLNRVYTGPFVPSPTALQTTNRSTMRQGDSLNGDYCFHQTPGSGGASQTGVLVQGGPTYYDPTPNGYSHPCMIDVNGQEYIAGGQGNAVYSAMWPLPNGPSTTKAFIPQGNPTHLTPLLGDRYETYGGTGSGATTGDRYVVQSLAGAGRPGIVAWRTGPNDTDVVRWIGDHRTEQLGANYREPHPQAWFGGPSRGGMVVCRSSWSRGITPNPDRVSVYCWLLPSGWGSADN